MLEIKDKEDEETLRQVRVLFRVFCVVSLFSCCFVVVSLLFRCCFTTLAGRIPTAIDNFVLRMLGWYPWFQAESHVAKLLKHIEREDKVLYTSDHHHNCCTSQGVIRELVTRSDHAPQNLAF